METMTYYSIGVLLFTALVHLYLNARLTRMGLKMKQRIDRYISFRERDEELMQKLCAAFVEGDDYEAQRLLYQRTKNYEGWRAMEKV